MTEQAVCRGGRMHSGVREAWIHALGLEFIGYISFWEAAQCV